MFLAPQAHSAQAALFAPQPQATVGSGTTVTTSSPTVSSTGIFINKFFEILLGLVGLVSVAFLMWGAIRYINALGYQNDLDSAKAVMINSIVIINITIIVFALIKILTNLLFQT
jgi:lysylphosphatidylglycerol synthetase-like protein (DUF2156 family)